MLPRPTPTRRSLRLLALAPLSMATFLVACGDDDDTSSATDVSVDASTTETTIGSTTTTEEMSTTTDGTSAGGATTTTDEMSSGGSSTTTESGRATTTTDRDATTTTTGSGVADALTGEQADVFASLLDVVGIDELTDGKEVTLLAPSDDAFSSIDPDQVVALLRDPTEVRDILEAHVIDGIVRSEDLRDGETLTAMSGDELAVTVDGDTITIGGATVVAADVDFEGGVIHVIDEVLKLPEG